MRRRSLCLALLVLVLVAGSLAVGAAQAAALGKGVTDWRLETMADVNLAQVPAMASEMGPAGLGATWTRVMVYWSKLQPTAPPYGPTADDTNADGYNDAYVAQLDDIVAQLRANKINVIFTLVSVPRWASNSALWNSKGYQSNYAMNIANSTVRTQFDDLGAFLASHFAGSVNHFECWNEPNLSLSLCPQTRSGNAHYAEQVYLQMLKAFHDGAKRGASNAVVIAGATCPRGYNDADSTSPLAFATYLSQHGAAEYCDAYSHHPYTLPAAPQPAPSAPPAKHPSGIVTLGNLNVLIKLFPGKPFYLTEYGYDTHPQSVFGRVVSAADQARYLTQAYAFVAKKYPQVKALLWFEVQDLPPRGAQHGSYMGLVEVSGRRKPSWYAFVRVNSLSRAAPGALLGGFVAPGAHAGGIGPAAPPRMHAATTTAPVSPRRPRSSPWPRVSRSTSMM